MDSTLGEVLPNTRNGLGYKNLIKIEFELAAFAREIAKTDNSCIPLLLLEEPESHMHPQLQQRFVEYLATFLGSVSRSKIQVILTSHSSHIASTMDFSKIRYAQKKAGNLDYKDLNEFARGSKDNLAFIMKYLTLVRCDLFYADKVILVEGSAERLLLTDMIEKCDRAGLFGPREYKLPNQYYAILEIGGAYAHLFVPLLEFLEIPSLIITDLDPIAKDRKAANVETGVSTSNATIKWWAKEAGVVEKSQKAISLQEIRGAAQEQKTVRNWHIEFQVDEGGLCGRSFEESIRNANRAIYGLDEKCTEGDLAYGGKCKTDFALELLLEHPCYQVPKYISDGLVWLNDQDSSK